MMKSYHILTSLVCSYLAYSMPYSMLSADEMVSPVVPNVNPIATPSNSPNSTIAPAPVAIPSEQISPSHSSTPSPSEALPEQKVAAAPAAPEECPSVTQAYPHRIQLKQTSGKGIGYKHGYSTVELFFSPFICFDKYLPFIDLKAHRFIVGRYAANAGIGLRGYSPTRKSFWGINAYYDYRQIQRENYKQASLGLEYLTLHFEWRINGYYPFGGMKSDAFGVKQGQHEFAMPGVNTEMAFHWNPGKNLEVTTALGPYYFHGDYSRYAVGGKARAKIELWNLLSFEGSVTYDNLFKWIGQGQISLTIPLGIKKVGSTITESDCSHAFTLGKRQSQPVERQDIIVTSRHRSRVINPPN